MPFPWNDSSIRADFISPRQIVVASDLTDTEELLPHVAAQAKASNSAVTLVHVVTGSPIEQPEDDLEEERYVQKLLGKMRGALEREGVRCSVVVRKGTPAEVVGQEIANTRAGRLIIGAHSHGPCGPNMIGSVANALLLTATVPVCVIGPEMRPSPAHASARKILHPAQPSGYFRESACFAAEIARTCGAELTLLHVMKPASGTGPYAKVLEARARREFEDFVWPPALRVRTVLQYGEPVEQVLHFAAVENVDLIVMGICHDFPWWSMRNSHTYQVIAESGCPVLTFHRRLLAQASNRAGSHLTASLNAH